MQTAHLCFIHITAENQVVHVSYGGNGGSIIEGVRHDDRVTNLDRYIQNQAIDGATYQRAAERSAALGDTLLYNLQVILGRLQLFARLLHTYFTLFKLFTANQLLLIEFLGA